MHYGGNHKTRVARVEERLKTKQQDFMEAVDEAITTLAQLVEESNKRVDELERQIEEQKQYSPFRRGAS